MKPLIILSVSGYWSCSPVHRGQRYTQAGAPSPGPAPSSSGTHPPGLSEPARQDSRWRQTSFTVYLCLRDMGGWTHLDPRDWSVYGQPVRTNNDTEGWHRRINARNPTAPPFYALVDMLFKEALFVSTQVKLVSDRKLKKNQRKRTREMCGRVMEVWLQYSEGGWSTDRLLERLACVYHKWMYGRK